LFFHVFLLNRVLFLFYHILGDFALSLLGSGGFVTSKIYKNRDEGINS
jgi:arginine--tRNA ligase